VITGSRCGRKSAPLRKPSIGEQISRCGTCVAEPHRVLVLVVAIVMVVFAAHIKWWWGTGAGIAALGTLLLAFPVAATSLEAWFVLEVLIGPAAVVLAVGVATLVATALRRRQLASGIGITSPTAPRPSMPAVAESQAPRSRRTSELGLAGYERRRARASEIKLGQLRLHESQP
jgi:hypothetical protein